MFTKTHPLFETVYELFGSDSVHRAAGNALRQSNDDPDAAAKALSVPMRKFLIDGSKLVAHSIETIVLPLATPDQSESPQLFLNRRIDLLEAESVAFKVKTLALIKAGDATELVTKLRRAQMFFGDDDNAASHRRAELINLVILLAVVAVRADIIAAREKVYVAIGAKLADATKDLIVFVQFKKLLGDKCNEAHAAVTQGIDGVADNVDGKLAQRIITLEILPLLILPIGDLAQKGAGAILEELMAEIREFVPVARPLSQENSPATIRRFLNGKDFAAGINKRRAMRIGIKAPLIIARVPADIELPLNAFGDAKPHTEKSGDLNSLKVLAFNFTPLAGLELFSDATANPSEQDFWNHSAEPEKAEEIAAIFARERARLGQTGNSDRRDYDVRHDNGGGADDQVREGGGKSTRSREENLCFQPFEIPSAEAIHGHAATPFTFVNGDGSSSR